MGTRAITDIDIHHYIMPSMVLWPVPSPDRVLTFARVRIRPLFNRQAVSVRVLKTFRFEDGADV